MNLRYDEVRVGDVYEDSVGCLWLVVGVEDRPDPDYLNVQWVWLDEPDFVVKDDLRLRVSHVDEEWPLVLRGPEP